MSAEDLSDGEILTGLYWSTHFGQHTEPAGAQWSHMITAGAHATDSYMESDFEFKDGYEQCLPNSPHSPAVPVVTSTATSLLVSTGELQAETPPCEVSTAYQDALHFRQQAESLYHEETQLFNKLTSPSPKRQRFIE